MKKRPTIVCRRGVWRGLELSIKSLPLRRKEPEDENLPVFLCLFPTGASLLANGRANTKKKVCSQHTGSFLQGPLRRGGRECAARQGEHNPPAREGISGSSTTNTLSTTTSPATSSRDCRAYPTIRNKQFIVARPLSNLVVSAL